KYVCLIVVYLFFLSDPKYLAPAFLFLVLRLWNKRGQIQYTELDILSITFIGMVIIFPLKAFQSSFILSFIISFIWIFMKEFNLSNSRVLKGFQTSLICIFAVLPFLINQTYQISIMGMLISFVLGWLFGKYIFPLTLIMLVCPSLIYENIFWALDQGLVFVTRFTFPISMPHISVFGVLIYYILFIYVLICLTKKTNKYSLAYIPIYFFIIFSLRLTNPFYRVTFIDVGQGDSILIELPHEQGNILIDSYNGTLEYLKSIGMKRLDSVVLSHFDKDHIGTIGDVTKNFEIGTLFYSEYEDESIIEGLQVNKKIIKKGEIFQVGNVTFEVLGPIQEYSNKNANSVVLKLNLENYSFLFTGDMTVEEEKDLILKYGEYLDCDVLKVAHHGSKTSSMEEFLNLVSPMYSIISVGEENAYGLPNLEVVERLQKNSTVYMTKDSGNIQITLKKKIRIKEYRRKNPIGKSCFLNWFFLNR
ncbi:MAG: MBL fold metallo-hydrolase, partial [Anaeroplasmataceae bacterium]|nr:MBL fold metallo-hydrolase [Anaeroplasmataceae bacterium]